MVQHNIGTCYSVPTHHFTPSPFSEQLLCQNASHLAVLGLQVSYSAKMHLI